MNLRSYKSDLILFSVFVSISLVIILDSYLVGTYISPDSGGYLREAKAIVSGNGFNYDYAVNGMVSHFATWPIGYPALIAMVSMITRTNVYLASKILSIIITLAIIIILRKRFGEMSSLYSLSLISFGYLEIFKYTWSEQPFILGMLWFSLSLYDVSFSTTNRSNFAKYLNLLMSSLFLFLSRYVGAFSVVAIGIVLLVKFLINFRNNGVVGFFKREYPLLIILFISVSFISIYLYQNKLFNGLSTGVERMPANDSFFTIAAYLAWHQLLEIANLTYFIKIDPFLVAVILFLSFIYAASISKRWVSRLNSELVHNVGSWLIFVGILYWGAIVYLRFSSQFDMFSFRLLYPATFVFVIGIIRLLQDKYGVMWLSFTRSRKVVVCVCLIVLVCPTAKPFAKYVRDLTLSTPSTSYANVVERVLDKYREVPSGSIVLFPGDNEVRFIRNDIYFPGMKNMSIQDFLLSHSNFQNVYVNVNGLINRKEMKGTSIVESVMISGGCSLKNVFEHFLTTSET